MNVKHNDKIINVLFDAIENIAARKEKNLSKAVIQLDQKFCVYS